jgi:hypothetical protein
MQHFSEEAWADFVRGTGAVGVNGEIEVHLARGCDDCMAADGMWDRLRLAAVQENIYAPPDDLVRRVKLELSTRAAGNVARAIAPVFDSFCHPLVAGVRSGSVIARQLLYEADGLTVDLRLEEEARSGKISAVGQVLDKGTPRSLLSKGTITLWTARGLPIVEANPNDHGEFQLEFEAQENLHLSIAISGRYPVRMVIPGATSSV